MKIRSGMKAGNDLKKCEALLWSYRQAKKNNQKSELIKLAKSFQTLGCKIA